MDSKDRLWIGTNDNGAAVRANGEFRLFGREEGLRSLSVLAICEDGAGNIILATTEGLVCIDSDYELHTIEDSRIEEKYVRVLKADMDGIVYGSTMDSCFFSMENLELTSFYAGDENGRYRNGAETGSRNTVERKICTGAADIDRRREDC